MDSETPLGSMTPAEQVCRAVRAVLARTPDAAFALRRANVGAAELGGPGGAALARVLDRLQAPREDEPLWVEGVAAALVRGGGALEQTQDHRSARAVYELAAELRPDCAATRLHAGRSARRAGAREAALAHYAGAQSLDGGGRLSRLARIGEALVSRAGERRLSEEIRGAVRDGDREAAGVGLEARAILRCETDRCREAIRDLCACALRYPDREDRARAAERVAALLTESNDLPAAREALLLVHGIGTPAQRASAQGRLHSLSVELGDTLGARRWSGKQTENIGVAAGRLTRAESGAGARGRRVTLPMLRVWRDAVERTAGAP